jgi:hypothetical protein
MKRFPAMVFCVLILLPAAYAGPNPPAAWTEKSNDNAQVLLEVMARFNPELAGQLGVDGLDEAIIDLSAGFTERAVQAMREAISELESRKSGEQDPAVRQDLEILLKAAKDDIEGNQLYERYTIPYYNIPRVVFSGVRALLDDQVPPERQKAALARLRRYAGMEEGYRPIAVLAEERTRERLNDHDLRGPARAEVEKDLGDKEFFVNGIGDLLARYQLTDYEPYLNALKEQMEAYASFVRTEVLPRTEDDYRLPPQLYAFNLRQIGVDVSPERMAAIGRSGFEKIRKEMQELASVVAGRKGFPSTDYRDVIRELKKDQLVGEAILPFYQEKIRDLEEIIRRQNLLTLPGREMRIRLASEAETAASPAPHMRPPRLIGNTGEIGEFVLPLTIPGGDGDENKLDDFTFAAAAWTLTAHEGRPGHELQFASIVEKGVSTARVIFAFNSVNVEGWGLYSEAIVFPFLPPEGQLIALQHRLVRAARAFLDPELQLGRVSKDEAYRILREDVVLSHAMATQEVERYTFRMPGQATSYFYGYMELMDLREEVERALGERFDQHRFHDFILSQGLLPPTLMREAVFHEFGIEKKI